MSSMTKLTTGGCPNLLGALPMTVGGRLAAALDLPVIGLHATGAPLSGVSQHAYGAERGRVMSAAWRPAASPAGNLIPAAAQIESVDQAGFAAQATNVHTDVPTGTKRARLSALERSP